MIELRKQGERDAEGGTQKAIFSYILAHPEGIEEKEIRNKLFSEKRIKEKRGIIEHLKKLEDAKVIKKRKKEYNNVWGLNNDFKNPKEFYDAIKFVFSVIDSPGNFIRIQNFLRMNEFVINDEFLRFLGIMIKDKEKREKLICMLCLSPSAFRELLFKILPSCLSVDKQLEDSFSQCLHQSDGDSYKRELANEFFNTDVSQRISEDVERNIKTVETYFWADMALSPTFGIYLKKSDFEKIKRLFKMNEEKGEQGTCICNYEVTQKLKMYYSPGGPDDAEKVFIRLERPSLFR